MPLPTPTPYPIHVIDVKQCGALGDGLNNDAQAIQAAVNAAISDITLINLSPVPLNIATSIVLYFPPGKYKINSTINFTDNQFALTIQGDNAIILPGDNFTGYAFSHTGAFDFKIQGINFVEFPKALYLYNHNLDTSQVIVESCCFMGCEEAITLECLSTLNVIEKCKFFSNLIAVNIIGGDKVVMRDNWISAGPMSGLHKAQIINHGVLTFESNLLVPLPLPVEAKEPAWINNYVDVTVSNVRQGGEPDSFTLINNFNRWVPYISGLSPSTVTVKDSQCYAIYGNNYTVTPHLLHPAIVRYVDGVPNSTSIRNNRGLIDCTLVDFSYELFYKPGHSGNIDSIINTSGTANAQFVIVEVVNNAGGVLFSHSSYVPLPLYSFVRDDESLWPSKRNTTDLEVLSKDIDTAPGYIIYKFAYNDFNDTLLLKYSGNPLPGGSTHYSGGYVGIVRSNGTYEGGLIQQALRLTELSNEIATPGSFLPDTYDVSLYWDETSSDLLPDEGVDYNSNRFFYIKIDNHTYSSTDFDTIKLIRLDKL